MCAGADCWRSSVSQKVARGLLGCKIFFHRCYNYYVAQVDMGDNSESSPSSHIVVKVSENGTSDVPKDSSVHMKQGDGSNSNATEQSSFSSQVSKS